MKRLDWSSPLHSHHGSCFWRKVIASELRWYLRRAESLAWLRQGEELLGAIKGGVYAWSDEAAEQAGVVDDPLDF